MHMSPILELPCHFPSHPTPLNYHRVLSLNSLHHTVNFYWLSNFTNCNVYVSMLLSQFVPPCPSPPSLGSQDGTDDPVLRAAMEM